VIDVHNEAKKEGLVNKFKPAKKSPRKRYLNFKVIKAYYYKRFFIKVYSLFFGSTGLVPTESLPSVLNCVHQVSMPGKRKTTSSS
jgi:hypothetical protein